MKKIEAMLPETSEELYAALEAAEDQTKEFLDQIHDGVRMLEGLAFELEKKDMVYWVKEVWTKENASIRYFEINVGGDVFRFCSREVGPRLVFVKPETVLWESFFSLKMFDRVKKAEQIFKAIEFFKNQNNCLDLLLKGMGLEKQRLKVRLEKREWFKGLRRKASEMNT